MHRNVSNIIQLACRYAASSSAGTVKYLTIYTHRERRHRMRAGALLHACKTAQKYLRVGWRSTNAIVTLCSLLSLATLARRCTTNVLDPEHKISAKIRYGDNAQKRLHAQRSTGKSSKTTNSKMYRNPILCNCVTIYPRRRWPRWSARQSCQRTAAVSGPRPRQHRRLPTPSRRRWSDAERIN